MKLNKQLKLITILLLISLSLIGCGRSKFKYNPEVYVKDAKYVENVKNEDDKTTRVQVEEEVKSVADETIKSLRAIGTIVVKEADENLDDRTKKDLNNIGQTTKNMSKEIFSKETINKLELVGKIFLNKGKEAIEEIIEIKPEDLR